MHPIPVRQHPLLHLLQGLALIPQVGGAVHQQAVARGGAQRVDDHQLPLRIFGPQLLRRQKGVMYRAGLAGRKRDVQQVALLQQSLEEFHVGGHVDLAGLGQLARLQKAVKPGQRRRIAAHVVVIFHAVHHVGVEQHGDVSALHIAVRQIHGRAAAQRKLSFHLSLHSCGGPLRARQTP